MTKQETPPLRGMDEGARKWMFKTIHKNHWRVAAYIGLDDLIQDGYWQWQRVLDKYPDVTHPAHLMRLYQRTLTGYLHDLATKRTREREMLLAYMTPESVRTDVTFLVLVAKAPPEIRKFLQRLTDDAVWEEMRKPFVKQNGRRETLNERLCRLTGIPATIDLTGLLVNHFSAEMSSYSR